MDFKAVNKSKSSNSAIASKPQERKNKKSRSSAEFQPFIVKKRGVYVEKKSQPAIDVEEAKDGQIKRKPPPRPRAGQKKFLASVLTILSKSTTGTQYPDIEEPKEKTKKKRWKIEKGAVSESTDKTKTKKMKFKSRILKNMTHRSENDQFTVLQSQKDIVKTPSNYSERSKSASESKKWSDTLYDTDNPKRSAIRDVLENNIYSGVAEGLSKQILEDKTKKKKLRINDDPVTFVSETTSKDDKKLYNFFVDLLETTVSVYNIKAEYENKDLSKTILEINESVAKKLEIINEKLINDNESKLTKEMHPDKRAINVVASHDHIPLNIKLSDYRPLAPVKPKIKAKSFIYPNYTRKTKTPPKANFNNKKKFTKKNDKKTLLNILKEELELDTHKLEEPESLYDALKILAKNKKRYEKSISFNKKVDKRNDDFESKCRLKRRKVLSLRSKKKNEMLTTKIVTPSKTMYGRQKYNNEINENISDEPSNHSLEVYGYDYEEPYRRPEVKSKKRVILTYHSSPSGSELMLGDCNALLDYPLNSASSSDYSYKR